jgi:two-component system response regulator CssR
MEVTMKYTIALVEDEEDLNKLIQTYLKKAGYEVIPFYNGKDALNNINTKVHLWILDIMLPNNISGYDIIKEIRKNNEMMPVIFTSARDKDLDKIIGLELGSDDYITKPYSPKELVLRVNNIIKRVYSNELNKIKYNDYTINLEKRMVLLNNKEIILTTLEFDLLNMFLQNKGKSFSRDEILSKVWGENYYGTDRVVDDLIRRLRKKMPDLNINTIYGYGYRLV